MSLTVTVVVPYAENESVFLQHVVQAALQVYRKHHNRHDQVNPEKFEIPTDNPSGKAVS